MKKLCSLILVFATVIAIFVTKNSHAENSTSVQSTPVVSASSSDFSWDKKKAIGVAGLGYYEMNSDWLSLYFGTTSQSTNTAGAGFAAFFEVGASDKVSIEISLGLSRLLQSDFQRDTINESYFIADILAHYHFYNSKSADVYAIGGAGGIISSGAAAPTVDVGIGGYWKLSDNFYLKTDFMAKSAVVLNRAEGRVGFAYVF